MARNYLSLSANITCNSKQESHTSRPPVTPRTPVPKTPTPWIWICHKCRQSYPFKATPRCLSCSHRFCNKCISELDYSGWMVYDSYWSRKTDPAAVAKRRCVWVTEGTNRRGSTCATNPIDSSEGHEKFRYEVATERSTEQQETNREEEERIWLEWQSANSDTELRQSHAEVVANNSVFTESAAPRRSRKRTLTINTDGIVEDVTLSSAGQELNWGPFLPYNYPLSPSSFIGTGSFTWEKSLLDQISEGGNEQDNDRSEESAGVLEHIIDPRLLPKTAVDSGRIDACFSTC